MPLFAKRHQSRIGLTGALPLTVGFVDPRNRRTRLPPNGDQASAAPVLFSMRTRR
jgi:hypothetical protein